MKKISHKISAASSLLLGFSQSLKADNEPWRIDFGVMNFIEQDRNTGLEFILRGSREKADGGLISIETNIDVITGATPNGASSSDRPQVFTMASGVDSYSVGANELPADDTHMDTRLALKTDIADPITNNLTAEYNAQISMEFDYLAFTLGSTLSRDFNNNNTTLLTGVNLEYNRVHPVGNIPLPLQQMQPAGQPQPRGISAKTKKGHELTLGINQIINQTSLMQLRLTFSDFSGYLNDGYKILSVIDSENQSESGRTLYYLFENRPADRTMKSLYVAYKKSLQPGILNINYRLYHDDWDIQSDTLDLTFKFKLDHRLFIKPGIRWYQQDQAFFYRHSLTNSEAVPRYASADSRLAEFDASTLGIEVGKDLESGQKQSLSIEYYTQNGESYPQDAIGIQTQQDLYPALKTWIIKYAYSFQW